MEVTETRFTWVMKNCINLLRFIGDIWEDGMEQNGLKIETLINNHHHINITNSLKFTPKTCKLCTNSTTTFLLQIQCHDCTSQSIYQSLHSGYPPDAVFCSQARGRWAGRNNLDLIAKKCNLGDWFLIYHLGRNMEPMVYGEFLKEFSKELENSVSTLERKPMLVGS